MAHDVTFTLPERKLGNSDIEFRIKRNGAMFGTLKISKGALVWVPANGTYGRRLTWAQLDQIAQDHGNPE